MAERRSKALLEEEDLDQELEFKDTFPGFSDAPVLDSEEESKLLPTEEQTKPVSFWEFKYYQKMFDVDTNQVLQRIVWSVIPRPSRATYLHRFIRPNPDLYGPFWICATLVFTIAVSNNIADYLQSIGRIKSETYYDYRKVSFTATTLYSYVFLMPLAVWGMLWYFQSTAEYRLLEIICIYGYSLAVYIPISVLWIIKSFWFQIAIIIVGFVLSSAVMMLTFWPAISETRKKISSIILMVILLFHLLLAFGFAVYFFHPQHEVKSSTLQPFTSTVPPVHPTENSSYSLIKEKPKGQNQVLQIDNKDNNKIKLSQNETDIQNKSLKHSEVTSPTDKKETTEKLSLATERTNSKEASDQKSSALENKTKNN